VNVFRHDGDVWTVSYAGRDVRLKNGKGPRYLATLLQAPGRDVHVLQLGAVPACSRSNGHGGPSHEGLVNDGLSIPAGRLVDDAPDERACREYRARLEDSKPSSTRPSSMRIGRAERLRADLDQLASQLAECFGTRTSVRGPAETARKAVTKVLRTQIGKLLDLHPALGRHLRDTVRMGTVCVYAPPSPVEWDVAFGPK
jgi:hypothetical protein